MRMLVKLARRPGFAFVIALAGCASTPSGSDSLSGVEMNSGESVDRDVSSLIAAMSEAEKLSLLSGYFGNTFEAKGYIPPAQAYPVSAGFVPGIARLGIPPQLQTDAGLGVAGGGGGLPGLQRTAMPSGIAQAASWDPELVRIAGNAIGAEAVEAGFNVMLAGAVNLVREPRNGRNFEYAGEDPLLAGRVVGASVAGVQQNRLISTVKHFALNAQETGRTALDARIAEPAFRESDLLAFQIAIEEGKPGAVMCAYNRVNGEYSCENAFLLDQVLRKDWGFRGYVLSDWGGVHSTIGSVRAGLDQQSGLPFDDAHYFGPPLVDALRSGEVTFEQLDTMVGRILRSMIGQGLLEPRAEGVAAATDRARHRRISRQMAEAGAVLLRNEANLLPLIDSCQSILVVGGYADKGVLSGGGSSQVQPLGGTAVPGLEPASWPGPVVYFPDPPLTALREALPSATIIFDDGTDLVRAAALARDADVVLVFANQWMTETRDAPLTLPDGQDALIAAVAAANPRTAVVLQTGGVVTMPWASDVGAILAAWYPGIEGGKAIANLLVGTSNPAGRTPLSFPMRNDDVAGAQTLSAVQTEYGEGANVGYRWFEARSVQPRYPFGFGLSYTQFAHDEFDVRFEGDSLEASLSVTNMGPRAGAEVVQIYNVGPDGTSRRLAGFSRVNLAPGQTSKVRIPLELRAIAQWRDGGWVIRSGSYAFVDGKSALSEWDRMSLELPERKLTMEGRLR